MKQYKFIITPSHGYLVVSLEEAKEAVRRGAKISKYSSVKGEQVYLEEDCDAGAFIQTMKIEDNQISETHGYFNSNIYPSFRA